MMANGRGLKRTNRNIDRKHGLKNVGVGDFLVEKELLGLQEKNGMERSFQCVSQ